MLFRVVRNHEGQFSVWRADKALPGGWEYEGTEGDRETCLLRIEAIWVDMRPQRLRDARLNRHDSDS